MTFTFCPTHKNQQVAVYLNFQSLSCKILFRSGAIVYFFLLSSPHRHISLPHLCRVQTFRSKSNPHPQVCITPFPPQWLWFLCQCMVGPIWEPVTNWTNKKWKAAQWNMAVVDCPNQPQVQHIGTISPNRLFSFLKTMLHIILQSLWLMSFLFRPFSFRWLFSHLSSKHGMIWGITNVCSTNGAIWVKHQSNLQMLTKKHQPDINDVIKRSVHFKSVIPKDQTAS